MGWPVFLLFVGAIVFALWRHRRNDLLLVSFPLLAFVYMQRQEMYFVRWMMPLIPPMCVLAAEATRATVEWLLKKQPQRRWSIATVSLTVIMLLTLPSMFMAAKADHIFSRPDTRTEALEWISQNIPPQSQLAVRILSPPWTPPLAMPGLPIGPYHFAQVPNGGIADVEMEQYADWQVKYIIATSFYYAQPKLDKVYQAEREARMQALDEQAELLVTFNPYAREYSGFFYHDQVYGPANDVLYRQQPGPIIKIYRLP